MPRLTVLLIALTSMLLASFATVAGGHAQRTVLITGSNRGIGYEFVKQYADKGYRVIATCRNPKKADELNTFATERDNVVVEKLDLMDLRGIDKLANKYESQPIDVLINNAALMRGPDEGQSFGSMDYDEFDRFFHTNVRGPLKVAEAFWPHVMASEEKMVAHLTTSQGRQGIPIAGFAYYKSSKAAIDNLHLDIGRKGRKDGVRVITLIPGRVPTHGEPYRKGMTKVNDSVSGMIEVMESHTLKQNGKTFWYNGAESS